jgi:acyl carrier protein
MRGSAQDQGIYGMATRHYQIREILAENGRLAVPVDSLDENADLFAAGLDSLAIVNVLMRLEEHFDIELPDEMLQRRSFSSIATIDSVVTRLTGQVAHT